MNNHFLIEQSVCVSLTFQCIHYNSIVTSNKTTAVDNIKSLDMYVASGSKLNFSTISMQYMIVMYTYVTVSVKTFPNGTFDITRNTDFKY